MTLTASEVLSLTSGIDRWEYAEYACTAFVAIACFGEYTADFTKWWRSGGLWRVFGHDLDVRKDRVAKFSTLFLIAALAGELLCVVRTNQLSGELVGNLGDRSEEAFSKSGDAISKSDSALSKANSAIQESSASATKAAESNSTAASAVLAAGLARREADSFELDIRSAKEQATSAESHLAEAVALAKAEETELLKLEKQVAPRVLSVDQQRKISVALKAFKDRAVSVTSYGLDGEGAAVATQIIAALTGAGIKPADHRAETIVSGGFEFGVHVRGPATEQAFVLAIADALSSIGTLQVWTNKGMARPGMVMSGGVTMGGPVTMAGASSPPGPDGPTAPGTPVTIAVGIKPVEILLAK